MDVWRIIFCKSCLFKWEDNCSNPLFGLFFRFDECFSATCVLWTGSNCQKLIPFLMEFTDPFFFSFPACVDWCKQTYRNNRVCFNPTPLRTLSPCPSSWLPQWPSCTIWCSSVRSIVGPSHTRTLSSLNLSPSLQPFPAVTLAHLLMQ